MAAKLTQGTKEYILVDLTDQTGEVTDLGGTFPTFDVNGPLPQTTAKYANASAVIDGTLPMRLRCMIDTTKGGLWPTGSYKLYVSLQTLPELPRIGPFKFTVVV